MKIGLIGFGEAGEMFGRHLSALADVKAFDINADSSMRERASAANIELCMSLQNVALDADYILSLVTADQAKAAAQAAAPYLSRQQYYLEMNSVAPQSKLKNARLIPSLVDVAIMAPVNPSKQTVPLCVAHIEADHICKDLKALGLNARSVGTEIGQAAAIKLCRSLFIKGLEALTIEGLSTAYHYDVQEEVLASLDKTFPDMDWRRWQADYNFERVATHGRRRAAEMREAGYTVAAAGLKPTLSEAIAKVQDDFVSDVEGTDAFQLGTWMQILDQLKN